jgi:hypothetical protein
MVLGAHEAAVAAGGGLGAFLLCWRGFEDRGTEDRYMVFKSHHLRGLDWGAKVLNLGLFLPSWLYRHFQEVGWRLWPLRPVLGELCRVSNNPETLKS